MVRATAYIPKILPNETCWTRQGERKCCLKNPEKSYYRSVSFMTHRRLMASRPWARNLAGNVHTVCISRINVMIDCPGKDENYVNVPESPKKHVKTKSVTTSTNRAAQSRKRLANHIDRRRKSSRLSDNNQVDHPPSDALSVLRFEKDVSIQSRPGQRKVGNIQAGSSSQGWWYATTTVSVELALLEGIPS